MRTEILFHDQMIPVRFISSDQKTIPLLIQVLESCRIQPEETQHGFIDHIDLIEVIGNNAILYTSFEEKRIQLPLY
jgi:RNA-binding protein YhbY